MAIFTAIQATQAVTTLATTQADQAHQELIAKYQDIFDFIQAQALLGKTSVIWTLSKSAYTEILPDLTTAGYTVSTWPQGITDTSKSAGITITWPQATATTYPAITSISPNSFAGAQNVYFSAVFKADGGTAPYTYTITGAVPTGLSWTTLTNVIAITLSGTPTQPATEYSGFTITATDQHGKTLSQTVTWDITATNIITVATQTPGKAPTDTPTVKPTIPRPTKVPVTVRPTKSSKPTVSPVVAAFKPILTNKPVTSKPVTSAPTAKPVKVPTAKPVKVPSAKPVKVTTTKPI